MLLLTFLHKNCMMYIVVRVRGVAQFGRALRSGRRGRRFKSCHPDEKENPWDSLFLCAARGKEINCFAIPLARTDCAEAQSE